VRRIAIIPSNDFELLKVTNHKSKVLHYALQNIAMFNRNCAYVTDSLQGLAEVNGLDVVSVGLCIL
jgi:hypothetical protein